MKNMKWVDRLDDNEIKRILNKDLPVKKMPDKLDNKLLKMIRNREDLFVGEKIETKKYFFQFAFAFSSILIIIISSIIYFNFFGFGSGSCIVADLNGNAYKVSRMDKILLKINDKINENSGVLVEESSHIDLKIGRSSDVKIKENSDLKIVKLYKDLRNEKTNFYVNLGYSYYDLNLFSKKSTFDVETDLLKISVIGTKFSLNVNKDKSNDIEVFEGNVYVVQKFNLNYKFLQKINRKFANRIKKSVQSLIKLKEGDIVNISLEDLNNAQKEITDILNSIYDELKENIKDKKKIKEIIKNSETKIIKIIEIKDTLFRNRKFEKEEKQKKAVFRTRKLSGILDTAFTVRNNALTADDKNIYISSDSNNAIYCIDSRNGKLLWKFTSELIKDITSPAFPFLNELILSTPDKIFVLDKNGSIRFSQNVVNGTKYWAYPAAFDKKIFIPTAQNIYCFDDTSVYILENFPESLGQLYISISNNLLFYADSNENRVKIFDITKKSIIWESVKLENRIFSSPLFSGRHLYITDLNKNIIRFNYTLSNQPDILEIESGAVSNMVFSNGGIYFVNNSGWLYAVDTSSFNKALKIIKIDEKPDYNNYLTKKLLLDGNDIYFCSDRGELFYYDAEKKRADFIKIKENFNKYPLIGSPVKVNGHIYTVDVKSNIYRISKIYE
ncbi:MAG: FecR domain-containing protein [Spirochaetes bacterium]|nr:FecR domain-containing protein [Spirochaetota bacterium]